MTNSLQIVLNCDMQTEQDDRRVCVITGAGRGIGRAIAYKLAAKGHHIICISRSENSCGSLSNELQQNGYSSEYIAVDVSKEEQVISACTQILSDHKTVDILVNNAGITKDNVLLRMSTNDWNDVITTNLSSSFFWIKNLLHPMIKQRWGRIINMASVVGIVGNFGQANYAAAKAGLIGMTKSIAREVASRNITVNAIAPGFIQTDMTNALGENIIDDIKKTIPMKSLGTPDDVASAVQFLCSDDARYITGHVLNVDGGMAM